MLKNKKGSLQDLVFIGIVLLFASMMILIGFKITSEYNDTVQGMSNVDSRSKTASTQLTGYYPGVIDNTFLFLAIGLCIVTLLLAALVRIHPMFIAFYFIGLTVVVFACGMFSNIYQEMAGQATLSSLADQMVFMSYIMEYLPLFVGVFGILLMMIMYKLWKNAQ